MDFLVLYFIKVFVLQAILYIVYILLYRNTTWHHLNRVTLMSIIPISLLLPIIATSHVFFPKSLIPVGLIEGNVNQLSIKFPDFIPSTIPVTDPFQINWMLVIYLFIAFVLMVRFAIQVVRIFRMKRMSEVVNIWGKSVLVTNRCDAPFSFFGWIFIPSRMISNSGIGIIVNHEKVHADQLHTLDLLLMEFYSIVFWFNPFVYLFKKSLKAVHEYIADGSVIEKSSAKNDYLYLLLSSTDSNNLLEITNEFSYRTFKNRVKMITNDKTPSYRKLYYFLLIPIIAISLQAFSTLKPDNDVSLMQEKVVEKVDIPSIVPVKNATISAGYGKEFINPFTKKVVTHNGIDFKAPTGTPVYATADGVAIMAEEKENWGKYVVIKHGDEYQTWYAHLDDFLPKVGDIVTKGQVIGHVGNTGQSTGSHLHYMVMKNGDTVNPADYY